MGPVSEPMVALLKTALVGFASSILGAVFTGLPSLRTGWPPLVTATGWATNDMPLGTSTSALEVRVKVVSAGVLETPKRAGVNMRATGIGSSPGSGLRAGEILPISA